MITPGPSTSPPPAQQDAAAAVTALALARARLVALAVQAGQVLDAKVLGLGSNGLTQLAIAGQTLSVRLPAPLPPGTVLQVQVQIAPGSAQPTLIVQPQSPQHSQQPPVPLPVLPLTTASTAPLPLPTPTPTPTPSTAQPSAPLPAAAAAVPPAAQAPLAASAQSLPAAMPVAAPPPPSAAPAAASSTVISQPQAAPRPVGAVPVAPAPPAAAAGPTAPSPIPPAPSPAPTVAAPQPPTSAPQPAAPPSVAPPAAPSPGQPAPVSPNAPPAIPPAGAPVGVAAPPPQPAQVISPAPVPPSGQQVAAPATSAAPGAVPVPPLPAAPLPQPHAALPFQPAPSPAPGPPPAGSPASAALSQVTQAAARQDSVAPLLQNLAALQGRMAHFPRPVAEAMLRVLAGRLVLGPTTPGAEALKQAVMRSGVFAAPPATLSTAPAAADMRTGLLQLRGALMNFLGAEIAPVAPVTRRPPPPTRDGPTRAARAEMPSLPEGAGPREAGRTLLQQTDAALSRLRLLQLVSQPPDAARGAAQAAAAAADWSVEVPLLLGAELAVAQLRISRDSQGRERKRERGWQLRFSVNFSILGEVGAQIGLSGRQTSIMVWAEEPSTALALEEMLPELGSALSARGLEVGTLRVTRGAPGSRQQQRIGQLVDNLR